MAYRIIFNGREVVCDTPQEVAALTGYKELKPSKDGFYRFPRKKSHLMAAIESLSEAPQTVIKELLKGERSDTQLRELLKADNNKAVAGILSGISKVLIRHEIDPRSVLKTDIRREGGNGERSYSYSLNPDKHEEISLAIFRQKLEDLEN
jgi:hypothetical protein